jgi:hypothetical protein
MYRYVGKVADRCPYLVTGCCGGRRDDPSLRLLVRHGAAVPRKTAETEHLHSPIVADLDVRVFQIDEFHDKRADAARLSKPVNLGDVRVAQGGQRLRFALEPGEAIRVVGEEIREDFDRHIAIELPVPRTVDKSQRPVS